MADLVFFVEILVLGLDFFAEEPDLDFAVFALLLPSTLGDGCVSPVACDGVFTLRTLSNFFSMRCTDRVIRLNGSVSGEGSSEFVLEDSVASSVALVLLCSTESSGFVLEGSVACSVALSLLHLTIYLVVSNSWLRSRMSLLFFPLPKL